MSHDDFPKNWGEKKIGSRTAGSALTFSCLHIFSRCRRTRTCCCRTGQTSTPPVLGKCGFSSPLLVAIATELAASGGITRDGARRLVSNPLSNIPSNEFGFFLQMLPPHWNTQGCRLQTQVIISSAHFSPLLQKCKLACERCSVLRAVLTELRRLRIPVVL